MGENHYVGERCSQGARYRGGGMEALGWPAAAQAMGMALDSPSGFSPMFATLDTNSLYLQITNVADGLAYLNLMNGTDYVYEIFSKTDLTASNWNIAGEVFPSDTNCAPFTVPALDGTNLFIWARDWTGVTSNGNTTPEWWFYKYFGTVDLSDTNLDSTGNNTLLSDYQNGTDPNVIAFTVEVTNNYVNNVSVPIQLNVTAGTPEYLAVSVDDTNYEADANWQTDTGTNLTVNLDTNQGWHDIWVGLKGPATNATVTWVWKRLKLDTMPPLLVVTNPVVSTMSVPLVQVQGYSLEEIAGISYDLTNALGLVTNQDAGVTEQFYSTNTYEYTTNWFECVDVPLTNGLNIIILRATDMAGNTTTTNISVTLDYSSRTNPPALNLYWPQAGTLVCNSNYTWRGWVDDPMATVVAQLIDTNGDTNIFNGIVERNGNFWVENLPLSAGTNWLTLTATDSAGNVAMTNITVMSGAVNLAIVMPSDDQLWSQGLTVNGTISDADDYTVWVNGVKAADNGDGTWTATNVYLPTGGTALIQARAIPDTDNGGNGTGGGGGGPVSYDNLGNPDPPQDNDLESGTDRPSEVVLESAAWSFFATYDMGIPEGWEVYNIHGNFSAASGGHYHYVFNGQDTNRVTDYTETIDETLSNDTSIISGHYSNSDGDDYDMTNDFMPATVAQEEGTLSVQNPYSDPAVPLEELKTSDVCMVLHTGGKAGINKNNLFQWGASAWEELAKPPYAGEVPPTQIEVAGCWLNSSSVGYEVFPDNASVDCTPEAHVPYYAFTVGAQKYKSYLTVYVNQPDPTGTRIWTSSDNAGHAWWCISTEAPMEAVNEFNKNNINLEYLGVPVGYGVNGSIIWTLPWKVGTAPGILPYSYSNSYTTNGVYEIDFMKLYDGLSYTEDIHQHPGTYSLPDNTCVTKTIGVGGKVGIALPLDETPENFGKDLPPSD
jgi:hypothetical protein